MKIGVVALCVITLFYFIPFQDLIVSWLYLKQVNIVLLKILLVLKELIVLGLGSLLLLNVKASRAKFLLILFLIYATLTIPFSSQPLVTTLIGLRTYLLLVFSFIIGEKLGSETFEAGFYKHLNKIFLLILVFSFLEYFVLPMTIWKDVFPVMEMKREVGNLSTTNEYKRSGFPVNAFGELTRRMLGPFDEPLYMAYFTVIILNFYIARIFFHRKKPQVKAMLAGILIFLTQTRAIIVGLILSIAGLLFKSTKLKVKYLLGGFAGVLMLVVVAMIYYKWVSTLLASLFDPNGRNVGHIKAYVHGLQMLLQHPFGQGVGSASSAVAANESTNATENAFINLGLELGLLGMLFVFIFFVWLAIRFRDYLIRFENVRKEGLYHIVATGYLLILQFTFAGLTAPHILTARIIIPFMIVMGWSYSVTRRGEEIN
jgi:hypothetical protein